MSELQEQNTKEMCIKTFFVDDLLPKMEKVEVSDRNMRDEEKDKNILDISAHYDMLVRSQLHIIEYQSLSKMMPQYCENWTYFEQVYDLAEKNDWDPKMYIECQFEMADDHDPRHHAYPVPYMLLTDEGVKGFCRAMERMKGRTKEEQIVSRETRSVEEEIIAAIIKDVNIVSGFLNFAASKWGIDKSDVEKMRYEKVTILWGRPHMFSPFYLWSVGWVSKVLSCLEENEHKRMLMDYFAEIDNNWQVQQFIKKHVEFYEQEKNLPDNMSFEMVDVQKCLGEVIASIGLSMGENRYWDFYRRYSAD